MDNLWITFPTPAKISSVQKHSVVNIGIWNQSGKRWHSVLRCWDKLVNTPVHTGIIWPHGWPKVIFQSWNIIMILLTAIEKCCGYSKPLRLFHSNVWFICDNRSKLKKSGILSGGPLSTKKPWLHLVEHCGLTSWARGLSLVAAESAWNGLHVHITKTIFLIY